LRLLQQTDAGGGETFGVVGHEQMLPVFEAQSFGPQCRRDDRDAVGGGLEDLHACAAAVT